MENFLTISSLQITLLPRFTWFTHSFQISVEVSKGFPDYLVQNSTFTLCGYILPHPFKPTIPSFSWAHSQTFLAARCGSMWLRVSNGMRVKNVSNITVLPLSPLRASPSHVDADTILSDYLSERIESNSLDN